MSELPLILAVDEDPEALERITGELQRYARDYRVVCGPSSCRQSLAIVNSVSSVMAPRVCSGCTIVVH